MPYSKYFLRHWDEFSPLPCNPIRALWCASGSTFFLSKALQFSKLAPPTSFLKLPKFLIITYLQFPYLKNENVCLNYLTGVLKLLDEIINDMWKQAMSGGECLPAHWGTEIESPQVPGQSRSKDPVSKEKKNSEDILKCIVDCINVEMEIKENMHRHFTGCKSRANGQRTPRTWVSCELE